MPFTLSHPAAALLLRRTGLPVPAVVAGAIAPDVPMFIPGRNGYDVTHSWMGVVSVDVAIAMAGFVAWVLLLRDACVDLSPSAVRERLPAAQRSSRVEWALAPLGAAVGAATHVVWDAFTHPARWGAQHVAWLSSEHLGVSGAGWAQVGSSVAGLAVVVAWAAAGLGRQTRRPRPAQVPRLARSGGVAVVVVAAGVGVIAATSRAADGLYAAVITGAVVATATMAVSLLGLATLWKLLTRRRRDQDRDPQAALADRLRHDSWAQDPRR